jgi:hypothetical protein
MGAKPNQQWVPEGPRGLHDRFIRLLPNSEQHLTARRITFSYVENRRVGTLDIKSKILNQLLKADDGLHFDRLVELLRAPQGQVRGALYELLKETRVRFSCGAWHISR